MSDFINAVIEARHELDKRDFNSDNCIVYCHPETLEETKDEMDYVQPFTQGAQVHGMDIEATKNIPMDMVAVVHLEAALLGPEAIQFQQI